MGTLNYLLDTLDPPDHDFWNRYHGQPPQQEHDTMSKTTFSALFDTFLEGFDDPDRYKSYGAPKSKDRQPTWKYSSHQFPSVDLVQHKDKIVLLVDLPGMDKQDIRLDILDDHLCISGTRAAPADVRERQQERWSGPFERKVQLRDADYGAIKATMNQGVLIITIPRAQVLQRDQSIKID